MKLPLSVENATPLAPSVDGKDNNYDWRRSPAAKGNYELNDDTVTVGLR